MEEKLEDEDLKKAFFSGHTSISAVNSFFLAKVYADYFPESKWRALTWSLAAAVPAFTGYLRVKAGVGEDEEVPSSHDIWPGAEWHEREVWDMMGIRFSDHPNMTRILMWDGYPYHPLRKEYPLEGIEPEKVYRMQGGDRGHRGCQYRRCPRADHA